MKSGPAMSSLPKLAALAALTTLAALDAAPAAASPESDRSQVRDHRTEPSVARPRRYRKRPGPRLMMPLKVDIGAQGADSSQGFMPGMELRAGIHWASMSPRPTNFDIGLGVFGAVLAGPENDQMPEVENDVLYGGLYLEGGQTLSRGSFYRTWATGRAEYFGRSSFGEEDAGFGIAGRLSAELFASGAGIEPRGIFLGTYALGVYAEVAGRQLGNDVSALQGSVGLTFRTPTVFAF